MKKKEKEEEKYRGAVRAGFEDGDRAGQGGRITKESQWLAYLRLYFYSGVVVLYFVPEVVSVVVSGESPRTAAASCYCQCTAM